SPRFLTKYLPRDGVRLSVPPKPPPVDQRNVRVETRRGTRTSVQVQAIEPAPEKSALPIQGKLFCSRKAEASLALADLLSDPTRPRVRARTPDTCVRSRRPTTAMPRGAPCL